MLVDLKPATTGKERVSEVMNTMHLGRWLATASAAKLDLVLFDTLEYAAGFMEA